MKKQANQYCTNLVFSIPLIVVILLTAPSDIEAWRGYSHYPHFYHGYHYGHGGYFSFTFPIYGGYYYPNHGVRTYPDSVLVYKESADNQTFLRLTIQPSDTEIFLDGNYKGTADALRGRSIRVSPGDHELQLQIDGYSQFYRVDVAAGSTKIFAKNLLSQ